MDKIIKNDSFRDKHLHVMPQDFLDKMRENEIFGSLLVTNIGYFPIEYHHYVERPCGCDSYIFIYCSDGEGFCNVADETKYPLQKGQIALLPADIAHRYYAVENNPWSIYWMHLQGTLMKPYWDLIYSQLPMTLSSAGCAEIEALFNQTFQILKGGCQQKDFFCICQLANHILGIAQYAQSDGLITPKGELAVQTAITYMKQNLHRIITLNEVAHVTGYSASYLMQLFRRVKQVSPIEYFLHIKIQSSSNELYFTQRSIKEIALAYGFQDPFYFSRLFKNHMGVSPRRYRNQIKG